jgi:hypothetical protein
VQRGVDLQGVPVRTGNENADEVLLEDERFRYFTVAERGTFTIFCREAKTTGAKIYLLSERLGEDGNGQPVVKGRQFVNESAARQAMRTMAG